MMQILSQRKKFSQHFNDIDSNLKISLTTGNNKCISFLNLSIQRKPGKIELGVYRKERNSDITIHNNSNHPQEHKTTAYRFYINRLITLPLTQKEKQRLEYNIKDSSQQWLHHRSHQKPETPNTNTAE